MTRLRPVVVVHYHEISLKRGNRPLFLRHLARNLRARHRRPRPGARCASGRAGSCSTSTTIRSPRRCATACCACAAWPAPRSAIATSVHPGRHEGRDRTPGGRAPVRVLPHQRPARVQDLSDVQRRAEPRARRLRARARADHARGPRATSSSRSWWRSCPTRRSCRSIVGRGRAGCRWAPAARWRRCSRAASTRRWRRGG